MSTATVDRNLYAVETPPTQQERLGLLLRLRRAARRALDAVLALPKGAAGWVLRHTRTLLSVLGEHPTLARIGARLRDLGGLIRTAGPVAALASVLSIPAAWRATTRVAGWIGAKVTAAASAAWGWTRSLLGRFGPGGTRVATTLAEAGAAVGRLLVRVAAHPVTQTITQSVRSAARLVRPVSQSLVVHRLLARFVALPWARIALEILALPFITAPGLTGTLGRHLRPVSVIATQPKEAPAPAAAPSARPAPATDDVATVGDEFTTLRGDELTTLLEPQNRAERRARQQGQVHAKRTGARR